MTAIRQHIIPRFLLKGFPSRIEGKEIYTWVYRVDGNIFEANIINVGVEKYFYGIYGSQSVDEDITEFEGRYAPLIDQLREYSGLIKIDSQKIAEFITHLVIRTKHVRDSFCESSGYLINEIIKYLSNFDNLKQLILSKPNLMDDFKKKIRDHPAPRTIRRELQRLVKKNLPALLETQREEMLIYFQEIKESIIRIIPKAVKEGHIKNLSQSLIPEPRVERYIPLKWIIFEFDKPLIFGDIGCLIETKGRRRYKSIDLGGDELINVFLPINHRKLLIGTMFTNVDNIELSHINADIAMCCREFFISSEKSTEVKLLIELIGKEAEIISKEEIEKIVDGIVEKGLWR